MSFSPLENGEQPRKQQRQVSAIQTGEFTLLPPTAGTVAKGFFLSPEVVMLFAAS